MHNACVCPCLICEACSTSTWTWILLQWIWGTPNTNNVGYTGGFQDLVRSGAACVVSNCVSHFWRSLWIDLRASPRRDFAVLLVTFGFLEPEERNSSNFSWSNSKISDSTVDPRNLASACATIFSSIEKTVPAESPSLVWSKNFEVKFLWVDENYKETIPITKERRISRSLLCLRLVLHVAVESESYSPLTGWTKIFSWIVFEDALKEIEITPLERSKHWSSP